MTEGAKDACVSRRLRQQHPGLYNKLLVEEVFMKNTGSIHTQQKKNEVAYMSAEERRRAQQALDVYVPARCSDISQQDGTFHNQFKALGCESYEK